MNEEFQAIEELCTRVTSGGTPSRSNPSYWDNGDIPWMKTGEIKQNFVYTTGEYITQLGLDNSAAKMIPENSVVVALYGDGYTAGSVAVNKIPLTTNQACCNLVIDETKAHYGFVYYYLKGSYANLVSLKSGGSQQNLNGLTIKSFPILKVAPFTQRKIAAILTAYDDLIETNKRRIALLEKMAEELYREWFVRMRFPGHQTIRFVKGVPVDWKFQPIKSFCKEIRNGVKKRDLVDNEIYMGLEHIPRKSIAITSWVTCDSVESDKLRFQKRDILFSKIRPYLHKVALTHFTGACSSDTIVLRPRKPVYEGFLLYTVFSDTFVEMATISSKGTKMPRADWAFLERLELKVPPLHLLEMFQTRFAEIFSLIEALLESNQKAIQTRDLLLPRLISGKLSVEDLDIQFPPSMRDDSPRADQDLEPQT